MPIADYERAAALIKEYEEEADFAGPRPAEVIEAAESALGLRFPPTYRRFLAEFGAGNIGATEIYGVIDANFADSGIPDAVWYNLDLRRGKGYDGLFVFYGVGDGQVFCLDTSRVASDGEMPVVCAYPGADEREEIASDFGSAFFMLVEQALDQDEAV